MRTALLLLVMTSPAIAGPPTIEAAQDAYVRGDYQQARSIAEKLVRSEGERAWRLIAASSCFLKEPDRAQSAADHIVTSVAHMYVEAVCRRRGIEIKPRD